MQTRILFYAAMRSHTLWMWRHHCPLSEGCQLEARTLGGKSTQGWRPVRSVNNAALFQRVPFPVSAQSSC